MPEEYAIRIEKGAKKALAPGGMSAIRQRIVRRFVNDHLRVAPLGRVPGKTKDLKGRFRGVMQYDIDNNYRLMYRVDPRRANRLHRVHRATSEMVMP